MSSPNLLVLDLEVIPHGFPNVGSVMWGAPPVVFFVDDDLDGSLSHPPSW